jgi:hypothetical protein
MDFETAKTFLNNSVRSELRDHAFGDVEMFWSRGKEEVGTGYFGGGTSEVYVQGTTFTGQEAHDLRKCGVEGEIHRNDETGPDLFVEGFVEPGLTKEGVFRELTGE